RDQLQSRPYRALGVVLMGLGIAEVDEDTVAKIFRHKPVKATHGLGDASLISRNDLAQILRVHAGGECGRADEVGEHHRDLATLSGVDGRARGYSIRRRPRRLCTRTKHSNGLQELESSAKRNTDLAEMILRQIVQNRVVDGVLAECRLILFEAKAPQPTSEVHEDALTCPARMMVQAKQR